MLGLKIIADFFEFFGGGQVRISSESPAIDLCARNEGFVCVIHASDQAPKKLFILYRHGAQWVQGRHNYRLFLLGQIDVNDRDLLAGRNRQSDPGVPVHHEPCPLIYDHVLDPANF